MLINSRYTLEVEPTGLSEKETGVQGSLNDYLKGEKETSKSLAVSSAMYFNPNINPNNTTRETLFYRCFIHKDPEAQRS